jgi:predicted dehydrogenase
MSVKQNPCVAVVGLGYWGPNLLRVLMERTDLEVKWICDPDGGRLEPLRRRYPAVSPTEDLAEVLDDSEVDAVLLATPVFTHYELARRCLAAGKHTFVEKPLASSSDQALALVDFATEHQRVLRCGHTFLYSPPVRAVRELIASEELGELYFISSSRVNLGLHQREVSVVWDLGPHDFSILLYWLDELPTAVRTTGRDSILPGIADVAFVSLEFPSGTIANVELSWLAPSKLRRTVVVGSKKMVVYEDGAPEAIKIFDRGVVYQDPQTFGQYHLSYRTGDIVSPKLSHEEPLALQMDDFIRAVRTGWLPDQELSLALDVVRLAEAAETSLTSGGAQVELAAHSYVRTTD